MKILMVTAEAAPLAKTGGLGDVLGALPAELRRTGLDVRIIMPLYKRIKDQYRDRLRFRRWSMIKLGWRTLYSGLLSLDLDGVPVYFIDNEYYFGYDAIYLDDHFDIERFSFFQRAVLDALGEPMDFTPDVLHLHDWHTGMIPCLLEAHFRPYGHGLNIRTVLTIHNLKFQGFSGPERIADLMDLPDRFLTESGILQAGLANFMKAGIVFADRVTAVSPGYAQEIMTDAYGEGLNQVLQAQAHKVSGLLNGIDTAEYDPARDGMIPAQYSLESWQSGKRACKAALQAQLGLAPDPDALLAGMVTRLTDQKGLGLVLEILDRLLAEGLQLAILGSGEARYEQALAAAAGRYPGQLAVRIAFDNTLARRIYAGSDLFLMPSLFEPCGLSQMIAMRYGALPVVRATGGLKDTVAGFDPAAASGAGSSAVTVAATGFSFDNIDADEFLRAIRTAGGVYRNNRPLWQKLTENAMSGDYSWDRSAGAYRELYRNLAGRA
ncbi:MAG TPA: glycogen synthase GlgA [Clostridiales bacterium]|nr:glycogen synthase GlgA [Clostridiales bacterium]